MPAMYTWYLAYSKKIDWQQEKGKMKPKELYRRFF